MFSPLSTAAQTVLTQKFGVKDVSVLWERPQETAHGDLATPVALQSSKEAGVSPKEIAEAIADALSAESSVLKAEVAGPGYVNVFLTPDALIEALGSVRQACTAKVKNAEPAVVVEYSGPNIAKPLGIHHILSTVIGQAIANIYEHLGYNVEKVNHIGDWGTQFGKLFVAYTKCGAKPVE